MTEAETLMESDKLAGHKRLSESRLLHFLLFNLGQTGLGSGGSEVCKPRRTVLDIIRMRAY